MQFPNPFGKSYIRFSAREKAGHEAKITCGTFRRYTLAEKVRYFFMKTVDSFQGKSRAARLVYFPDSSEESWIWNSPRSEVYPEPRIIHHKFRKFVYPKKYRKSISMMVATFLGYSYSGSPRDHGLESTERTDNIEWGRNTSEPETVKEKW